MTLPVPHTTPEGRSVSLTHHVYTSAPSRSLTSDRLATGGRRDRLSNFLVPHTHVLLGTRVRAHPTTLARIHPKTLAPVQTSPQPYPKTPLRTHPRLKTNLNPKISFTPTLNYALIMSGPFRLLRRTQIHPYTSIPTDVPRTSMSPLIRDTRSESTHSDPRRGVRPEDQTGVDSGLTALLVMGTWAEMRYVSGTFVTELLQTKMSTRVYPSTALLRPRTPRSPVSPVETGRFHPQPPFYHSGIQLESRHQLGPGPWRR